MNFLSDIDMLSYCPDINYASFTLKQTKLANIQTNMLHPYSNQALQLLPNYAYKLLKLLLSAGPRHTAACCRIRVGDDCRTLSVQRCFVLRNNLDRKHTVRTIGHKSHLSGILVLRRPHRQLQAPRPGPWHFVWLRTAFLVRSLHVFSLGWCSWGAAGFCLLKFEGNKVK